MTDAPSDGQASPTKVRYLIVASTTVMALLLYLDRFAVGIAAEYMREDLRMTQGHMSLFLSAFFFSYALAQVPGGWVSDRFGARGTLALYILGWSLFTGLMGGVYSVSAILLLRLLCGLFQAGAYPTAGGMIRVWFPLFRRGVASSIVALGGRAGAVLAPLMTAHLMVTFSTGTDPQFRPEQVLSVNQFLTRWHEPSPDAKPVIDRLRERLSPGLQQSLAESKPVDPEAPTPGWYGELVSQVAAALADPDVFTNLPTSPNSPKGVAASASVSALEQNRLQFDAAFTGTVERLRGRGWRPTMIVYGLIGIVIALGFYALSRDTPAKHPWCNTAEQELIDDEPSRAAAASQPGPSAFPWKGLLTSVSLWGNSLMQVFTNIGWVFVVTWLPRYLDKVHHVPLSGQAIMTAIPTAAGIVGMYLGGVWTDRLTAASGRKWGRRIPILATRITAATGYALCLGLSLVFPAETAPSWIPWGYVAALSLMVFSVDMGNPAVWGYAQDVGGESTGVILGWANMWGNLGAAAAPLLYGMVLGETPTVGQWNLMFAMCLVAFVLSGACSLVMDSDKPLNPA